MCYNTINSYKKSCAIKVDNHNNNMSVRMRNVIRTRNGSVREKNRHTREIANNLQDLDDIFQCQHDQRAVLIKRCSDVIDVLRIDYNTDIDVTASGWVLDHLVDAMYDDGANVFARCLVDVVHFYGIMMSQKVRYKIDYIMHGFSDDHYNGRIDIFEKLAQYSEWWK